MRLATILTNLFSGKGTSVQSHDQTPMNVIVEKPQPDELITQDFPFPGVLKFNGFSVLPVQPIFPDLDFHKDAKLLRLMKERSPHWAAFRMQFVEKHPFCAVCGYTEFLNVHHIIPFHVDATKELVEANLITLGEHCPSGNHHYLFGHFLNWRNWNPNVIQDAANFLVGIKTKR